jgi:hypothetical protein
MRPRGGHLIVAVVLAVAPALGLGACSASSGLASSSAGNPHGGSSSPSGPVYDVRAARREAKRLLGLVRLPRGARRQAREPAGAGRALASYAVNVPVVPHLVDLHEYFVVPASSAAGVVRWMERHRPKGSSRGDSGSSSAHGEQWTSFDFRHVRGFAVWPDLVANTVGISGGRVALRVDAQIAPRPRLPSSGRGPGDLRVVDLTKMLGYRLRCDPAGGTLPNPARACAAIKADPALLYSVPGLDHSCPAGGPSVSLRGIWRGRPVRSSFSICTGGQEDEAGRWAALLPSGPALSRVRVDRGIGPVRLGEREQEVVELLRGPRAAPATCRSCSRRFQAGFSADYGGGLWTVTFSRGVVSRVAVDFPVTVDGEQVRRGYGRLQRILRDWTHRSCTGALEFVHGSARGSTAIVYGSRLRLYKRVVVSRTPVPCTASS